MIVWGKAQDCNKRYLAGQVSFRVQKVLAVQSPSRKPAVIMYATDSSKSFQNLCVNGPGRSLRGDAGEFCEPGRTQDGHVGPQVGDDKFRQLRRRVDRLGGRIDHLGHFLLPERDGALLRRRKCPG